MKSYKAIGLIASVGTSVKSFSPSSPNKITKAKGTPTTLYIYNTGVDTLYAPPPAKAAYYEGGTDFWGTPRNEREIIDYISNAVFNGASSQPNANEEDQCQWVEVLSAEPPLVVVHGFLEHGYCDEIIDATIGPSENNAEGEDNGESSSQARAKNELKRSTTGNVQDESDYRTSTTAWLQEEYCPLPLRTFASRSSALSGLPPMNMENLQVVRYEPGQEFKLHTDHLDSFNEYACGGRLCTCLVYLNDSKQSANDDNRLAPQEDEATFAGGETRFPEFNAKVRPTKGSALFFWNTLERPGCEDYCKDMFLNVDMKLRHAGLPVLSGEKWVANRWIHPRDFGAGVRGLA